MYIADSKIELFLEKDLQFANLTVLRLLRYTIISSTLQLIGHTTTYCAGSLVEKIIIFVPFDMQSAYFLYFRSRHEPPLLGKPKSITFPDVICSQASRAFRVNTRCLS